MAPETERVALVAGGLGVIGRAVAEHFADRSGWRVVALSRRAPDFDTRAEYRQVDLMDRAATADLLRRVGPVTHLFYAAYQEHRDPVDQVGRNLAMLENLVTAAEAECPDLRRVVLYEGVKYYGVHLGPFKTPAKENDPRHMPPNFYYDQEDWLRDRARDKPWDAVFLRPDVVCGFAVGNPMNLTLVIAVYAAISKELGLPLRFPGRATGTLAQVTDAAQLARASEWAAVNAPGGEAYNVTNGDLFRWEQLWPSFAEFFGMAVGPPLTIPLASHMADKKPVWERIAARHGLAPYAYETIASWGFGDFIFNCAYDVISSTTKLRKAGFTDVIDSEEMFLRMFAEFRARRVIP
jgi:nucleoside-diphosphate-sugar epimerase